MVTYKQKKKEESRLRIWKKAVSTLTIDRERGTLINEDIVRRIWHYTFKQSESTSILSDHITVNNNILSDFCDFVNQTNKKKYSKDLKVIYFCGPEPENDLEVMLSLGIRLENIWAIEQDKDYYVEAIANVKIKFPTLKIYKMKFKDFCESFPKQKFDIIYLDFTSSLFSTNNASTIHYVFDYKMLDDFGILVTNNAVPTKEDIEKNNDKYTKLLTSFFVKQEMPEACIIGEKSRYTVLSEVCKDYRDALLPDIKKNFYSSYSSFCTLYPIFYSTQVSPAYKIFSNKTLSSFLIDESKLESKRFNDNGYQDISSYFVHNLNIDWEKKNAMYENKESGTQRNRKQSIDIVNAVLGDDSLDKLECEFISDSFKTAIENSYEIIRLFEEKRFFCDLVFIRTLAEFTIFQLGYPYHANYTNHERFSYKAKDTEMNIDIFTFDSCRSIYDWYPLFEMYENNINLLEKQIILRISLDLINGKQTTWAPIRSYRNACNMIAVNEPFEIEYFRGFTPRDQI